MNKNSYNRFLNILCDEPLLNEFAENVVNDFCGVETAKEKLEKCKKEILKRIQRQAFDVPIANLGQEKKIKE